MKPLSDRLVSELTAHRTLALCDALARDPQLAYLAALHAMVLRLFYRYALDRDGRQLSQPRHQGAYP